MSTVWIGDAEEQGTCSAEVISNPAEIESLADSARHLLGAHPGPLSPHFFLASIVEKHWIPRVVVVQRAGVMIGVVYTKERKFAGLPTGLIYADATLGTMVASEPREREQVWRSAISCLMTSRSVCGMRIHIPQNGFELAATQSILATTRMELSCTNSSKHVALPLSPSYDLFLQHLGTITRRKFRYYRRRFEKSDRQYVETLPHAEFRKAALQLLGKSVKKASRDSVERALKMLDCIDRPLLTGLRANSGEWLAILGGWYEFDHVMVFFQMNNDHDHPSDSLSVVLRAYLIESLIEESIPSILFWDGAGGPLGRYCHNIPTDILYLDRSDFGWRIFRSLLALVCRFLPPTAKAEMDLITAPMAPPHAAQAP